LAKKLKLSNAYFFGPSITKTLSEYFIFHEIKPKLSWNSTKLISLNRINL